MAETGGWRQAAEREFREPFLAGGDGERSDGFDDWPEVPEPDYFGVVNWRTLPEEREPDIWRLLSEWVSWLCTRYVIPARLVPDCWYLHDGIVEELSALFSSWEVSFEEADSGGHGPLGWHERFEYFRSRLRHYKPEGCANGHLETMSRTMPEPPDLRARFERPAPDGTVP
jgi:hypothetical protein